MTQSPAVTEFADGGMSVEELEHQPHDPLCGLEGVACPSCMKELEEQHAFDSIEGVRPPLPRTTEEFVATVRSILR